MSDDPLPLIRVTAGGSKRQKAGRQRQHRENMDTLRTCVMLVLLAPVSCEDVFFTEPVTCYMLDGILMAYCIIATMLYFRLKFSSAPCVTAEEPDLRRPLNPDPYQDLEPVKRKKKDVRKKKPQKTPDKKVQQTLSLSSMEPPLSP